MRDEINGWPWFSGLCTDYVSFKLDWEKYHGEQPRLMSQAELVARQGHLLLVFANIEEMLRALPQR